MKNILIASLILVTSAAGICLAGNNATGNGPNPPITGKATSNSYNAVDNRATSTTSNSSDTAY